MDFFRQWLQRARQRLSLVAGARALTAGVVVAILASTALLLWDLRLRELAHARTEIVSLSRILSEQTTRAFDGVNLVLRSVQERLDDTIGQKIELDSQMAHFLLRARAGGLPQLASVFLVNADGEKVISSTDGRSDRRSVAGEDYFRVWKDGHGQDVFVGRPARNPGSGRWSLPMSRRLSAPEGGLRGVVVAEVDLDHFQSLYSSITLDFVSPILLLLNDGTLLVSHPRDEQGIGKASGHPGVRVRLLHHEGDLKLIEEEGVRSVAYRTVSNFPLLVGVAIGLHESLTPWREIAWPVAVGALLVALAIALAGWRLAGEMRREGELLQALQQSNRQLRDLSSAMEKVRESERARIARELHDELGQKLTGLKLELGWLMGRLKNGPPELLDKAGEMKVLLGETIDETRRISSELRPLMLDELGFEAAAEWLVQNFCKRSGVPVDLDLDVGTQALPEPVATALFRILQESLTNVMRHAGASAVQVNLRCTDGWAELEIRDNGCGLPAGAGQPAGLGLVGIRERVHALGGRVDIGGAEGKGVRVKVTIPLG